MANTKFYVVWVGRKPGIYTSWPECQKQVTKFTDAKFKSFETKAEADKAYAAGWKGLWGQASAAKASRERSAPAKTASFEDIDYDSISVDVGTNGNPGPVEYKGVDTRTGEIVFSCGPIHKGTNNLGEFLAIVHALTYLKETGSGKTVYTDSMNALKWVKQKAVSSTLVRDASTKDIWELVDRAEEWLRTNKYENKILKWQTREWGEIKADYGRK
ncbi:MAG: ribonuclease H-related protein [Paenibacillus sp.]|nr:ribonuclease H-related protein [Paenibacillus sp.]